MCVDAAKELEGEGKKVRVVSMPCVELFEEQSADYKKSVIDPSVSAIVSCEAASSFGWGAYSNAHVGIDGFGASAPAPALYKKFGITVEAVVAAAKSL
mmetsp:Transcript_11163/g.28282  ORF Transcript_11163/g.28282 Transcript_11163/m.28282 type:complete len:98 (+) Transcript_11163:107-400(+)